MSMIQFKAPNLPIPPVGYEQDHQQQLANALRLYFSRLDSNTPIQADYFLAESSSGDRGYFKGRGDQLVNPYGAWQSNTTQTATANTATVISIPTADYVNGTSVVSNTKMTVDYAGIYNLQWSGQFQNTDNAHHDVYVWIRKNGTDVVGSTGLVSVPARKSAVAGDEGHLISGWNYFIQLAANDYVELWWATESALVTLEFYPAGTGPTRPSTASVIATLSFVSAIP